MSLGHEKEPLATTGEGQSRASEYLTSTEAAEILHVSPKTVNRWANEGQIICMVTLGGHRRFRRDDVEAVAEAMRQRRPPSHDGGRSDSAPKATEPCGGHSVATGAAGLPGDDF